MSDMLSRMNGGELIGFFAVVGALVISVSAIVGALWTSVRLAEFRTRRAELEAGLKQDMLSRGMSVDEIERVIAAGELKASPYSTNSAGPHTAERAKCS